MAGRAADCRRQRDGVRPQRPHRAAQRAGTRAARAQARATVPATGIRAGRCPGDGGRQPGHGHRIPAARSGPQCPGRDPGPDRPGGAGAVRRGARRPRGPARARCRDPGTGAAGDRRVKPGAAGQAGQPGRSDAVRPGRWPARLAAWNLRGRRRGWPRHAAALRRRQRYRWRWRASRSGRCAVLATGRASLARRARGSRERCGGIRPRRDRRPGLGRLPQPGRRPRAGGHPHADPGRRCHV